MSDSIIKTLYNISKKMIYYSVDKVYKELEKILGQRVLIILTFVFKVSYWIGLKNWVTWLQNQREHIKKGAYSLIHRILNELISLGWINELRGDNTGWENWNTVYLKVEEQWRKKINA